MPLWVRILHITAVPEDAAEASERHREHLRDLHRAGKLHAAGELEDGDGFLEIFEAGDLLEADAIARNSPLVEDGLATWVLREWRRLEF